MEMRILDRTSSLLVGSSLVASNALNTPVTCPFHNKLLIYCTSISVLMHVLQ